MRKENWPTSTSSKNKLVVGLNHNGEIIQFDKECQRLTGYSRTDVLQKKIDSFLISPHYVHQWQRIFQSVLNHEEINDLTIPWMATDGSEIIVSLSSLPLETNAGSVRNICFIGECKTSTAAKNNEVIPIFTKINKTSTVQKNTSKTQNTKRSLISTNDQSHITSTKKAIGTNKKNIKPQKTDVQKKSIEPTKKSQNRQNPSIPQHFRSLSKPIQNTTTNAKVKDLTKKFDKLNHKLNELEKKDRKLERKNKLLEKNLKNLKKQIKTPSNVKITSPSGLPASPVSTQSKFTFKKFPKLVQDPFGIKRKKGAFEQRIQELDKRTEELHTLESQLISDRKNCDKRIAGFTSWKEKLLSLEAEIEKRRQDLVDQEETLREKLSTSPVGEENIDTAPTMDENAHHLVDQEKDDYHMILDKIPQGAAIIQRSIVRQVNNSFAELIGFETAEIVDKSLFDFIAPEGLLEIEKYYIGRLKGSGSSSYGTIFSTKENDKISVEVSVKPTTYNGEKAEIAVIQEMEKYKENLQLPTADEKIDEKETNPPNPAEEDILDNKPVEMEKNQLSEESTESVEDTVTETEDAETPPEHSITDNSLELEEEDVSDTEGREKSPDELITDKTSELQVETESLNENQVENSEKTSDPTTDLETQPDPNDMVQDPAISEDSSNTQIDADTNALDEDETNENIVEVPSEDMISTEENVTIQEGTSSDEPPETQPESETMKSEGDGKTDATPDIFSDETKTDDSKDKKEKEKEGE